MTSNRIAQRCNVIRQEATTMWIVERSDIAHRSRWATGHDAKHYIGYLGQAVPMNSYTFDVRLPSGEHVRARVGRGERRRKFTPPSIWAAPPVSERPFPGSPPPALVGKQAMRPTAGNL